MSTKYVNAPRPGRGARWTSEPPPARSHSAQTIAVREQRHFVNCAPTFQYINIDSPPKLIAVTSAVSGEGKTTTAVNLASAMAEAGLTGVS